MKTILTMMLSILVVTITACAGESSSINDSATTVTGDNKATVAASSVIAAEKAIESESAPGRALISHSIRSLLDESASRIANGSTRATQTVDVSSEVCNAGGSASYEIDTSSFSSQAGTYTINYSNCTYTFGDYTTVTSGSAEYTFAEDGSFSYSYDMTVTYDGETVTLSGTLDCTDFLNCTYEETFTSDGVDYRISEVSVSGNSSSGYDISARVYHEELGYVDMAATGLIACTGSGFSSGSITITDSTNTTVLTVTFVSCTEMTVTYDGVSETVSQ